MMGRSRFPGVGELSALPVTLRAAVLPEWIDMMGHMNVCWYTHVFSHAVGGLLELVGIAREDFLSGRTATAALEVHVNYLGELRVGARLRIHSRLLGITQKRFHAMSFLVDEDSERLSATSEGVATFFDRSLRKSTAMPSEVAARAGRLAAEHAALPWAAPVCGVIRP
jgi:acyl-CoA thioester hydrolase